MIGGGRSNVNTAAGKPQALGTSETIREVVRRHGIRALYTGFRYHLYRDTAGTAVYFGVYEATKQGLRNYLGIDEANTPFPIIVAGALCGSLSWGIVSFAQNA